MRVVILVCRKDLEMYKASVEWMQKLCKRIPYACSVYYENLLESEIPRPPFDTVTYKELHFDFLPYPAATNVSFAYIARDMRALGENFIWYEPDCAVLKDNWVARLEAGYRNASSPHALVTNCSYPPHDLSCGVGVWSKDVYSWHLGELVCCRDGFDGSMFREKGAYLFKSELVKHCYGVYDATGKAFPPQFTDLDLRKLLSGPACIYHKVWSVEMFKRLGAL